MPKGNHTYIDIYNHLDEWVSASSLCRSFRCARTHKQRKRRNQLRGLCGGVWNASAFPVIMTLKMFTDWLEPQRSRQGCSLLSYMCSRIPSAPLLAREARRSNTSSGVSLLCGTLPAEWTSARQRRGNPGGLTKRESETTGCTSTANPASFSLMTGLRATARTSRLLTHNVESSSLGSNGTPVTWRIPLTILLSIRLLISGPRAFRSLFQRQVSKLKRRHGVVPVSPCFH